MYSVHIKLYALGTNNKSFFLIYSKGGLIVPEYLQIQEKQDLFPFLHWHNLSQVFSRTLCVFSANPVKCMKRLYFQYHTVHVYIVKGMMTKMMMIMMAMMLIMINYDGGSQKRIAIQWNLDLTNLHLTKSSI